MQPSLSRLFDHMDSPPDKDEIFDNIENGQWPGLETRSVSLPSGAKLGLGVFATQTFRKGCPVAHYPSSHAVSREQFLAMDTADPRVDNYAQEIAGRDGPIVLLAHDVSAESHFGHLINHTPCQSCCNLTQVVQRFHDNDVLIFRAKRRIKNGEQLLRDYGEDYLWPDHKVECPECGVVKATRPKV